MITGNNDDFQADAHPNDEESFEATKYSEQPAHDFDGDREPSVIERNNNVVFYLRLRSDRSSYIGATTKFMFLRFVQRKMRSTCIRCWELLYNFNSRCTSEKL